MSDVEEDLAAKIESMNGYKGEPVEDILITLAIARQSINASQLVNAMNIRSTNLFQQAFGSFVNTENNLNSMNDLIKGIMSTPMTEMYPLIVGSEASFDQQAFMKLSGKEMSRELRRAAAKFFAMTAIFNWAVEDFSMPEGAEEALNNVEPDSDAS